MDSSVISSRLRHGHYDSHRTEEGTGQPLKIDEEAKTESDMQMDKENDKLLNKPGNGGSFKGQRYGDPGGAHGGPGATPGIPRPGHRDSSISSSSVTRDISRRTSDKCLSRISEEEVPQKNCKRKVLKYVVTVLFIIIVVGIVVIWTMHEGRSHKHNGNEFFDFVPKKRVLNVYNYRDDIILTGFLKSSEHAIGKTRSCGYYSADNVFCFYFDDETVFKFETYQLDNTEINCINLVWENLQPTQEPTEDCYDIEYGLWYGLPNFQGQFWPIKTDEVTIKPLPYRPYQNKTLGHVLESYWLSTMGIAIISHQNIPLKVSYNSGNNKRLCLSLDSEGILTRPYPNLNYTICQGPDVKQTFMATRNHFYPAAEQIDIVHHDLSNILWTYESRYSSRSDSVGGFLHKLNEAGLPIHMVEFDSAWEKHPGDLAFETATRNELSQHLQTKYTKTKLMLPISLACSYLSVNFFRGVKEKLFGKDLQTKTFQTLLFHDEACAIWDASNPSTRYFILEALKSVTPLESRVENKFPHAFEFQTTVASQVYPLLLYSNASQVNMLDITFLNVLLSLNKSVLMETAYRMQDKPIFVEIPTTIVNKNNKKCLDYIITGALTAGIHGYPYVTAIPPPEDKVDEELFMRWLEIAMFFPGLKITSPALSFGDSVKDLTKNVSSIRESLVLNLFAEFMSDVAKGYPLLRPVWWINPYDYKTLKISNQFMIGDVLLLAPILCHGDRKRDIYIPEGMWVHSSSRQLYTGGQWLRDFHVPLHEIPVFKAVKETVSNTTSMEGLTEGYT